MTKNSQHQPIKQGITPDKASDNHRTPNNKKHPYPFIISHFIEKVKHKMNPTPVKSPKITTKLTQKFQPKPLDPGLKMPKNYELKAIKLTALALTTFLVTLLASSILAPVQTSSAETLADRTPSRIRALVQSANYTLTISSTGANMNLVATPDGNITAGSDTVKVKTDNPSGYKLYISTTSSGTNGNKLYLNGNASNVGATNSISASSGSFDNPITLSDNTWGYALTKSDAANVFNHKGTIATTDFSDEYDTTNINPNSTWAGVPAKGGDQLIKVTSTADQSDSSANVDTTIYYGIKATSVMQSGTYSNTVLYTAISDSAALDAISISPSSLATNASDRTVVMETSLVTNVSNIDASTVTATIGGQDCANISLSNNESTGNVDITCTAPLLSVGSYTIQVTIPDYGKTFTKESAFTYEAPATHALAITFAGTGVSKVQVRTAAGASGGTLMGEVTVSGNSVTGLTEDATYYLYPTFSSGYELRTWAKTSPTGTLSSTSATNPYFTIGTGDGSVTVTGKSSGPSLYSLSNGKNMQQLTVDTCKQAAIDDENSDIAVMTDSRDNNTYRVAKLADGNCWMTQNMRLGATPGALTTAKAFTLTSSNSNVNSNFTVSASNMANSGSTSWDGTVDAKHVYLTGDTEYGNYYNWYTATAGSGLSSTSSGDVNYSICPSSGTSGTPWRLPTNSGSNNSYTNLFKTKLGWVSSTSGTDAVHFGTGKTVTQAPYSFPLSGYYRSGVGDRNSSGYFWSRTANSSTYAYYLNFDRSGNFYLQGSYYKYLGSSVRCVLVTS